MSGATVRQTLWVAAMAWGLAGCLPELECDKESDCPPEQACDTHEGFCISKGPLHVHKNGLSFGERQVNPRDVHTVVCGQPPRTTADCRGLPGTGPLNMKLCAGPMDISPTYPLPGDDLDGALFLHLSSLADKVEVTNVRVSVRTQAGMIVPGGALLGVQPLPILENSHANACVMLNGKSGDVQEDSTVLLDLLVEGRLNSDATTQQVVFQNVRNLETSSSN